MPSFQEIQFPTNISLGASGGPSFSTDVVTVKNGSEQRNVNWSSPKFRFNIATGIKAKSDFDLITAFFYAQKGRAIGFRYKDWADYQATGQVIGTGDGSATVFQLTKAYISGSVQSIRTITKPVTATVKIYVDAVLQSSGVSVDYTTGIVTFTTPPAASTVISTDFDFDVPTRFDVDHIEAIFDSKTSFEIKDIPLVEVRI